jgi:TPR repeat protein
VVKCAAHRRVGHLSAIVLLGFLFFFSIQPAAQAQQNTDSQAVPCAPSALSQLIVPEGHLVRVNSVPEQTGPARRQHATSSAGNPNTNVSTDPAVSKAYKIFEAEARKGRPAAMVNLAVSSLAGWGAPPNAGTALYWLHAAAGKNFALAFYDLGILYFEGCGVRQDYAEAFRFFEQGANAGDSASQTNLGYFYDQGLGVAQDRTAAARWYRQAAERGESRAQYNLGDLYLRGAGVPQDDAAAFAWFQKAALQGHTGARIMLGSMYAIGRGAPKDLQAAYLWLSAAAIRGDTRGNARLLALEHQLSATEIARAKSRALALSQSPKPSGELALLH